MDDRGSDDDDLGRKIARLVEERGWNQQEFARIARVNRHTARQILLTPGGVRRLRNATIGACARALGLSVNDLRTLPLDRLLPRMREAAPDRDDARRRAARATHPELVAWLERNPDRAGRFTADEWEEVLALQDSGDPVTPLAVDGLARRLERRRRLLEQAAIVAATDQLDLLEQIVGLLFDKVRASGERR
jgi:transcriptional regulator with XRE-family HTH domain